MTARNIHQFGDGIKIGYSDTNYVAFAGDGEITMHGTARVRKHMIIPVSSVRVPGAAAPGIAIIGNFAVLQFAGVGASEQVNFSFEIPDDYSVGSNLLVHIHWAPTNTDAGGVVWQLTTAALASGTGELISAAGTTAFVIDAASTIQDELLVSDDMSVSGVVAEDVLGCTLFRDPAHGSDTYGSDASLVFIEVSYLVDKLGLAT